MHFPFTSYLYHMRHHILQSARLLIVFLLVNVCCWLRAQGRDPAHQGRQPGHHTPGGVQRSRKECNFLLPPQTHSSNNYTMASLLSACLVI
jgi:hypothetical protein